jgi:hypothetical protein
MDPGRRCDRKLSDAVLNALPIGNCRAAIYTGRFQVKTTGDYAFRSITDDGIIVWIDGTKVLELDSIHGPEEASGTVTLKSGFLDMKVWYFQGPGPASQIALQLWVTPPAALRRSSQ